VEFLVVVFCGFVAMSFFCYNMKKYRTAEILNLFKNLNKVYNIVTVNGSKIPESKRSKQHPRCYNAFQSTFHFCCYTPNPVPYLLVKLTCCIPYIVSEFVVRWICKELIKVIMQSPHIRCN